MQHAVKMAAGAAFPAIAVARLGGGEIAPASMEGWRLLVVYRGKHCPLCKPYLTTLDGLIDTFTEAGVQVMAVSADPVEKATADAAEFGWRFPLGYGLSYAHGVTVPVLPEVSGIQGEQIPVGNYIDRGKSVHGYAVSLVGADGDAVSGDVSAAATADGSLRMSALDYRAQEDSRRFAWGNDRATLTVRAQAPLDLDRQTNGDVLLVVTLRVDALPGPDAWIGLGCGTQCQGRVALGPQLVHLATGQWSRVGVPLKCFRAAGADMHHIEQPFQLGAGAGSTLALFRVALGTDAGQVVTCPK